MLDAIYATRLLKLDKVIISYLEENTTVKIRENQYLLQKIMQYAKIANREDLK
jgi:hypothetical protein